MKSEETVKKLKRLDDKFASLLDQLLELSYKNEINPQIAHGYRTPDEQDKLHALGRVESGKKCTNERRWQSLHQYGLKAIICFERDSENNNRVLWGIACKNGLDRQGLLWVGTQVGQFFSSCDWQLGRPDWRELCREQGVDPITLNRF